LNFAFLINAAILIMAAGVFHRSDATVTEIGEAYRTLSPLLVRLGGSSFAVAIAPLLFAVALLASGQASSITGTLAGQSVLEGFLRWKISPILRRLVTRSIAIVPALVIVLWRGEGELTALLIFSQVVLSFQLPFAMVPLVRFVSSRRLMGDLVLSGIRKIAVWAAVLLIIGFNTLLLLQVAGVIRD
jgi:manganese transport protein